MTGVFNRKRTFCAWAIACEIIPRHVIVRVLFQLSFTRSYSSTRKGLLQTRRDPLTPPSYNANERSPASKLWPEPKICCPWSISTWLSSTSSRIIFTHLQLRCSLDTRVKFDVFRNAYSDCDSKVYHKLRTTSPRGTGNLFPSCPPYH